MSGKHGHRLHFHAHSPLHAARPDRKILALLGFVLLVVATPPGLAWLFAAWLAVLLVVIRIAKVPFTWLLPRMVIELPFVVFALLMPFISHGPKIEVAGLWLSQSGLEAGGMLIAKGSLGVLAGLTLAATTEPVDLVRGLERLRLPSVLTEILAFMIRYLDVVASEAGRMRIALQSRGFSARKPSHWPVLARSAGALFLRAYERGERVHHAVLARSA